MTLKRRLERLEQVSPAFYSDASEIPTRVLEELLRRADKEGKLAQEEESLYQHLIREGH
tara:strand:+ start:542 stop:718 length:177 start_codon:yes stop_codon:yes gene_type:complete